MKIFKKLLIIIFSLLLILCLAGYFYQKINVINDKKHYKPVGKLYTVSGKKMHLYTCGNGENTVVFACGWGTANPYADYFPLYNTLSKHAKLAVYDRFGYGYSDITSEKRNIDTIVNEIHKLLVKAGQKPPYILVGHSLGSLETIRYAQRYRNEVKGIVLIDGGNPNYYASMEPITLIAQLQQKLIDFGVARFLYNFKGFRESLNSERNNLKLLPENLKELDKLATLIKGNNEDIVDEMRQSQTNAKIVIQGGTFKDLPITIITAGDFGKASASWIKSQKELKSWSTISNQFIVKDTKHYIHQYHPEIITNEILKLINTK